MYLEVYGGRLINLEYAKSIYVWPDESRNKVIVELDDKNHLLAECNSTEQAKDIIKSIARSMEDGQKVWRLK